MTIPQQQTVRYFLNGAVPTIEDLRAMSAADFKANATEVAVPLGKQTMAIVEKLTLTFRQHMDEVRAHSQSLQDQWGPVHERLVPLFRTSSPESMALLHDVDDVLQAVKIVSGEIVAWGQLNLVREVNLQKMTMTMLVPNAMLTEIIEGARTAPFRPIVTRAPPPEPKTGAEIIAL